VPISKPSALNARVSFPFAHGALLLLLFLKERLLDFSVNASQPFFGMSGTVPKNNLPLPQIRVLFPRLPAARKKDGVQDSSLGRSLPSPNPPLFAPGQQSHVRRHPPP
jgi:hypothetical protein